MGAECREVINELGGGEEANLRQESALNKDVVMTGLVLCSVCRRPYRYQLHERTCDGHGSAEDETRCTRLAVDARTLS